MTTLSTIGRRWLDSEPARLTRKQRALAREWGLQRFHRTQMAEGIRISLAALVDNVRTRETITRLAVEWESAHRQKHAGDWAPYEAICARERDADDVWVR